MTEKEGDTMALLCAPPNGALCSHCTLPANGGVQVAQTGSDQLVETFTNTLTLMALASENGKTGRTIAPRRARCQRFAAAQSK